MYCIYTDKEVAEANGNLDHIIPLALGGDNRFVVWCDEGHNSQIGSKVDGKLASDQLIMLARNAADARGHSNRTPIPKWKNSEFEGRPVQVSWGEEVKVWDAKAKAYLDPSEFLNRKMESRWIYDISARSRFTAKVALGAGYFAYGDAFRTATDCSELRKVIDAEDVTNVTTTVVAHDPVLKGGWLLNDIVAFRLMCECTGRTTLITLPYRDGVAFYLGVLGMYVGAIFCPGDSSQLKPEEGEVFLLGPGTFERRPFKEFAQQVYDHLQTVSQGKPET